MSLLGAEVWSCYRQVGGVLFCVFLVLASWLVRFFVQLGCILVGQFLEECWWTSRMLVEAVFLWSVFSDMGCRGRVVRGVVALIGVGDSRGVAQRW